MQFNDAHLQCKISSYDVYVCRYKILNALDMTGRVRSFPFIVSKIIMIYLLKSDWW